MNLNRLNRAQRVFNLIAIAMVVLLFGSVAVATGMAEETHAKEASALKNNLNGTYEKSLDELVVLTGELQNALSKVQVAGTPYQFTLLLSEIWRTAGEAETALCALPAAYDSVGDLSNFFNQTSDYAYVLLKKAAQSTPLANSDMEQLAALHNAAANAVSKLQEIQANSAGFIEQMDSYDFYAQSQTTSAEAGTAESETGEEGATQTANEEYPHLIYDGPFSESNLEAEPRGLTGPECSEAEAAQKAKAYLGDLLAGELTYTGRCEGRIPTHTFNGVTANGTVIDIDIAVTGGLCISFRVAGAGGADMEKPDERTGSELAELGRQYLEQRGLTSMAPTYAQYYGSAAVINYAYVDNGVTVYSDLIKVWVDVPSRTVVGVEASGYYACHTARQIGTPAITEAQAMEQVSAALEVKSTALTLIPITATDERLCYEFKCTYGGDSFIVYVNAMTGVEEQVYRIIDSQEGQLVV